MKLPTFEIVEDLTCKYCKQSGGLVFKDTNVGDICYYCAQLYCSILDDVEGPVSLPRFKVTARHVGPEIETTTEEMIVEASSIMEAREAAEKHYKQFEMCSHWWEVIKTEPIDE